jgi:PiT family inorganic phosphate transporter
MKQMLYLAISMCLIFALVNGFHDGCNVFATAVASRSIKPQKALLIASVSEFLIPLFTDTAVASTIGKVLNQEIVLKADARYAIIVFLTALASAIIWNLITWIFGLPSSSSHALIGGLVGAGIIAFGLEAVKWPILIDKILLVLTLTPFIGFVTGFISIKVSRRLLLAANCKINHILKKSHFLSIIFLAGSHSIADSQKTMGIIAMLLIIGGNIGSFYIPFWVKISSAAALALGLLFGGCRILHTVGNKIYKLEPMHSINAQVASATVIYVSSMFGGAVSTSQIISSTVAGVGAGERKNAVNWKVVENIVSSWILTIPSSAAISMLLFFILKLVLNL